MNVGSKGSSLIQVMRRGRRLLLGRHFDPSVVAAAQDAALRLLGFDPAASLSRLNDHLTALGRPPFDRERHSVHWLLFAAASLEEPQLRVLEIGTWDASFTTLLAALFTGQITTVELPPDDPIYEATYRRGDQERRARMDRAVADVAALPNVTSIRCNSFFLPGRVTGDLDLIWVDGGHNFPEVAWDIQQCWSMLRPGGLLVVDDVMERAGRRDAYVSPDSRIVLDYLAERVAEPLVLLPKRCGWESNRSKRSTKWVAAMRRANEA